MVVVDGTDTTADGVDIGLSIDVGDAAVAVGATALMLVGVMVGVSNVTPISVGAGASADSGVGAMAEVDDGAGASVNDIVGNSSAATIWQQLTISASIAIIRTTL